MPKTKVVNRTGTTLILKEGTANVFRMLCPKLQDGHAFTIKVDQNATYREYWCAVTSEADKRVVLSSDDCMDYEEVHIRLKVDKTYTWDAKMRHSHLFSRNVGDGEASKQNQAQPPPPPPSTEITAVNPNPGPNPGIRGIAWNKFKAWCSCAAN